jgi:hypothetical protein
MDKSAPRLIATLVIAGLAGLAIGYVDSRPTWDDAGVTVGALLIASALAGAAMPRWFWLSGLALGIPVPALNVAAHGNYGSALAIAFSVAGAGLGAVAGRLLAEAKPTR